MLQTKSSGIEWIINEQNALVPIDPSRPDVPIIWAPQAGSQELFLSCPIAECLYEGNRGPGKTDALLMDYAQHVGAGYGADWNGLLLRRTVPELSDVIKKSHKWFRQIFPDAKWNANDKLWTFRDGERLKFSFMSDIQDYWKYHGHEYPWIAWEELTNWASDECYKKMMSLNRSSNPHVPRKIRATCNPYGAGHGWVKLRFQLPAKRDNSPGIGKIITGNEGRKRVAVHGTFEENKVLLHADPNYATTLAESATNESERKAWLEGSWDIVAGGMFSDVWDAEINIIPYVPPDQFPSGWRLDRSYDHGQSRPFSVGFWAESNGEPIKVPGYGLVGQVPGDLIRFNEWYGWTGEPNKGLRLTSAEIADGIRERQAQMGVKVRPGVADSSIFDSWEPGKTVAGQMLRRGIKWLPADKSKGSRANGWSVMRDLMRGAHPNEEGYREHKGLFVMDNCVQFIRTIPVLQRSQKNLDDVNTDTEDHIADETRYRCRAKGPKTIRVTKG